MSPLEAQTRFQRPDIAVDLTRYKTVDDCLAAVDREQKIFPSRLPLWRDTAELVQRDEVQALPSDAIAVAKSCSAKFDPQTVSLDTYAEWMLLFLLANRDDAAEVVAERKLSMVRQEPTDSASHFSTLGTIASQWWSARPMRYQKIVEYVHRMEEKGVAPGPAYTFNAYSLLFRAADIVGDTATRLTYARKLVTLADSLNADIKRERWYQGAVRYSVGEALDYLAKRALLDSLRRSADAYIALKQANWARAGGKNTDPLPLYIGRNAPAVQADYWYMDKAQNDLTHQGHVPNSTHSTQVQRPSAGNIGLIIFLRPGCHVSQVSFSPPMRATHKLPCWDIYAVLRRMGERFPNLEITVLSATTGYLAESLPLDPQTEADQMRAWWLGYHRLPAALAVTNTSFFRLPGLDQRRIDNPVENEVNYQFGERGKIRSGQTYVVDSNGTILLSGSLGRTTEREFREILDIVTRRVR